MEVGRRVEWEMVLGVCRLDANAGAGPGRFGEFDLCGNNVIVGVFDWI